MSNTNDCFHHGDFPTSLKKTRIVPIFKSANPYLAENYRPISILNNISKIIEMLLYDRILCFCEKHKLIAKNQYGFQKKSSTASAVISIMDYLRNGIDSEPGTIGALIFIDLKKAFDTIPHEILLDKLGRMGFRGRINDLLRSYLTNRKQLVDISGTFSDTLTNTNPFATPQGSNLGPLLFVLFVNDIFKLKLHGKIVLFADDTASTYIGKNSTDLNKMMQEDLHTLDQWFACNKLTMNISKTKAMIVKSPATYSGQFNLQIGTQAIELVHNFIYLGINIQSNLKWDIHINSLARKIYSVAGVIKRLGNKVDNSVLISVYYSLVHSHLTYLSPVYGAAATQTDIDKLQVAQNVAVRRIFSYDYHILNISTDEIYKKYGLLKVREIISYNLGILIYKHKNNMLKLDHEFRYNGDTHDYPTRSRNQIAINPFRTRLGEDNTLNAGTRLFNSLHTSTKSQPTLSKFKLNLKKEITNQQLLEN